MKSSADRIREHLGLAEAERVIPTGSMWPVIRPGEAIRFRRSQARPRLGEIWVAQLGELHIVHRVLWVRADGSALLKGDFRIDADGLLPRSALFGPVGSIGKEGGWQPANRRRDRVCGLAWSAVATGYLGARAVGSWLRRSLSAAAPPGAGWPAAPG